MFEGVSRPSAPTCASWQEGLADSVHARLGAGDFFAEDWMLVRKSKAPAPHAGLYLQDRFHAYHGQGGWDQRPAKHLSLQSLNHAGALGGSPE